MAVFQQQAGAGLSAGVLALAAWFSAPAHAGQPGSLPQGPQQGATDTPARANPAAAGMPAHAGLPITVSDDSGKRITLQAPARRIVSLAPHTTELLFAAGAGAAIVAVTDYSDFPPAARSIPTLGSAASFDVERIAALHPDLVVAWGSGNPASKLDALRALGLPVFESEPRRFDTIATTLERLAKLAGTSATGEAAAREFRRRLQDLHKNFHDLPAVPVFYQVWRSPLMTLNGSHLVSQAISLCGGVNIFAALAPLAPTVSIESVVSADPEAILTGSGAAGDALADWRRYSGMKAVRQKNLFYLNSDTLTRAGPRMLDGTEALCRDLAQARARRG